MTLSCLGKGLSKFDLYFETSKIFPLEVHCFETDCERRKAIVLSHQEILYILGQVPVDDFQYLQVM